MKKKVFIILLIIIFMTPINIKADIISNNNYVINSYDINIKVNENNSMNIKENIEAYFDVNKHGIIRKIPTRNRIIRQDGTTSRNRAKITDIKVNEEYTTQFESGYKVIKIGNAHRTITGSKNYTIEYLYSLGKDTGKKYDELYYNLIGDEWDTSINNITFSITLPKEFDSSKLGFYSGEEGSTDSSDIKYSIDGRVISGKLERQLNPNEALTIRLELPEGYFIKESNLSIFAILSIIGPIILLLISYIIWNKYGKDDQVIETVEFYPPEGFNSAELGLLYKGAAESKDVTSLLIYLANKGYIKIKDETKETETKKSIFNDNDNYTIIKVKDYDGTNPNEKTFMDGLFKGKTEVTQKDLYNEFYKTNDTILKNINNKKNKELIFEKTATKKMPIILLMLVISLLFTVGIPAYEYSGMSDAITTFIASLIFIPFLAIALIGKTPIIVRTFIIVFTIIMAIGMFSSTPITDAVLFNNYYLIALITGIISLVGIIIFFKIMKKRTKYGNDMLGKIRGLKTFLETAEKDNLEAMVQKEPTYFYNILPFTYVLGISDKWIKKFESINLQAPDWYDSQNQFNAYNFGNFMESTMDSANSAMTSSPSSDSSSSGGGFSGGGSGGGGGSSW